MVEEGLLAERAGFHSVQVPDRHQAGRQCAFPGRRAAADAAGLRDLARACSASFTFVGTLVHPMKAAEQFAVIDRLSGGRLVTTVSRGFLPPFWGQFGVPEERMLGRFQETLRIWRPALAGERFDFDGEHWQVRRAARAGARAAVVAAVGRGQRRAGRDPALGGVRARPGPATRCRCARRLGRARPACIGSARGELGKRPFVVRMQDGWVADTREDAALRRHRPALRAHGRLLRALGHGPRFVPDADLVGAHARPGTADRVHRAAGASCTRTWGIDYVVFCCRLSTGPSLEAAREQIARFGEEVVAPVHARYPAPDHPAIPPACRV